MAGLFLFVIGVAGLVLLTRGVVGRRVGGEPRCRQCRYDLSGLDEGAPTCPECGRSLRAAGAVQCGLRRRRPIPIVAGTALLLAAIGAAGFATWASANDFNLNRLKPTWMLLDELERPDSWGRIGVNAEVRRRFVAGDLGDGGVDRLARIVVENEPAESSFAAEPNAMENWCAVFLGLLVHPGTGEAARSILVARALEIVERDPPELAQWWLVLRRAGVVDALDQLLLTGVLRDGRATSFLNLKIRPALSLDAKRVTSGALIPIRLTLDWIDRDLGLGISPGTQARYFLMVSRSWGSPPITHPLIRVDVVLVGGDAEIVSTHEPMQFESAFDWYVYESSAIRALIAQGDRSAPGSSSRTRDPGVEAALIRAPAAAGRYRVVFDVRLTALKPDPTNPGEWLEHDESAVEVVRRFEVEFEVRADEAEPAAGPVR